MAKRYDGTLNHCLECGACCAYFRVSFYWREAEADTGPLPAVPLHLTEDVDATYRCMAGTNQSQKPRCAALSGVIGQGVACTIYEKRPSPCRSFVPSYYDGQGPNEACDRARQAYGLAPLAFDAWQQEEPLSSLLVQQSVADQGARLPSANSADSL